MNYSIKDGLTSKELGGELFIYIRKNSTICSFNGTGVFIWHMLNKGLALNEISRHLCKEYNVLESNATQDVSNFVKDLDKNGLITFHQE